MENFREDDAWYRDDRRGSRCLDWDADVPAQDKTYVVSNAGAVICNSTCVDDNKIHEFDIKMNKS